MPIAAALLVAGAAASQGTVTVRAVPQPDVRPLVVLVRDRSRDEPVAGAELLLDVVGARRARARTDDAGRAVLRTTAGPARLTVRRIGFVEWRDTVPASDTIVVRLQPLATRLGTVEVRSRALGAGSALQASTVIGADRLDERMAPSIAGLLAGEPGISARSNGPMATQPVIRGLGGDRVLVLEDGLRTGDIATTAADHAVTIEPATARRIEVIRGPAGLLYGSNTLGGVVNVVRDDVPRVRPARTEWEVAGYGESVNAGLGASARVRGAAGPLVWNADGSTRTAGDTRTPGGVALPFTDVDGFDGGAALGVAGTAGFVGVAAREYRTYYGVPSSYRGVTLPGAHVGGVYVDVRRSTARLDGEWHPGAGPVSTFAVGGNAVRFAQHEVERGGFVGTRFGQLSASGEAIARVERGRHRGAVGVFSQWRDLRAAGSFTGTRPAVQRTIALFAVDEISLGRITALAGIRGDRVRTTPLDSTETLLLRDVRARRFDALTGAVGARLAMPAGWNASVQLARAFRPPSIEELYSAGPHLANYAYEVGSPSLRAERGTGVDLMVQRDGTRVYAELTAYAMHVDDYVVFAAQFDERTGLPLRDPRLRRYVVYRPAQYDARLAGIEGRLRWTPVPAWQLDVTGTVPRGTRVDGTPLPFFPSATARADIRRTFRMLTAGLSVDARARQARTPAAPEGVVVRCGASAEEDAVVPAEFCATPGAVLVGALMSARLPSWGRLAQRTHLTLTIDNLLDAEWRDPLWRAKQAAPQPGRNIRLAVRMTR